MLPQRLFPSNITVSAIHQLVSLYPAHLETVASSKTKSDLRALDRARFDEIPDELARRRGLSLEDFYVTGKELERLMLWKLSHGTFRPRLMQLAASNKNETVVSTTRTAFGGFLDAASDPLSARTAPALRQLSNLAGVGPATGSLLLSCAFPSEVPFMSDELVRWIAWEEGSVGGRGWKASIKYDAKTYGKLASGIDSLRQRLGEANIDAIDLEKAAWVMARMETFDDIESGEGASAKDEIKTGNASQTRAPRGSKRKAETTDNDVSGNKVKKSIKSRKMK